MSALGRVFDHESEETQVGVASSATDQQRWDSALDLYQRAVHRVEDLAAEYRTPVLFYWQPRAEGWRRAWLEELPPEVIDISDAFAGHEESLYIDTVHHNEAGATLIAEAMWPAVARALEHRTAP